MVSVNPNPETSKKFDVKKIHLVIFCFRYFKGLDSQNTDGDRELEDGSDGALLITFSPVVRVLTWDAEDPGSIPVCLMWKRDLNVGIPQCRRVP